MKKIIIVFTTLLFLYKPAIAGDIRIQLLPFKTCDCCDNGNFIQFRTRSFNTPPYFEQTKEMVIIIQKKDADKFFNAPKFDTECVHRGYGHLDYIVVDTSKLPLEYRHPFMLSFEMHHPAKEQKNEYGYPLHVKFFIRTDDGKVWESLGCDPNVKDNMWTFDKTWKEVDQSLIPADTEWLPSKMYNPQCKMAFVPMHQLPARMHTSEFTLSMQNQKKEWEDQKCQRSIQEIEKNHAEEIEAYKGMVRILAEKAGVPLPPGFDE